MAVGRSTNVEPTKTIFSGDRPPSLHLSVCWRKSAREKTGTMSAMSDFIASRSGGLRITEHREIGKSSIGDSDESTDIDRRRGRCGGFSNA
jgi:hypothetical protein